MTKAERVWDCRRCESFDPNVSLEYGWCKRLNLSCLANNILADCPLPDWPRVSRKTALLVAADLRSLYSAEGYLNWLRSIGVEIEEEKP